MRRSSPWSIVYFSRKLLMGGKLPGLYGGRQGCSGSDAAVDCFSTRPMWRKDGQGELYLYAPKDKQTDSLCNDPKSVCDVRWNTQTSKPRSGHLRGNRWQTAISSPCLDCGIRLEKNCDQVLLINSPVVRYCRSKQNSSKIIMCV
ncbi:hypothetical protein F5051DRAFT_17105 [Lentinula edodes]|nr:hypothetical protein F5051DRAFT_17105 [Lentinula edodes]